MCDRVDSSSRQPSSKIASPIVQCEPEYCSVSVRFILIDTLTVNQRFIRDAAKALIFALHTRRASSTTFLRASSGRAYSHPAHASKFVLRCCSQGYRAVATIVGSAFSRELV